MRPGDQTEQPPVASAGQARYTPNIEHLAHLDDLDRVTGGGDLFPAIAVVGQHQVELAAGAAASHVAHDVHRRGILGRRLGRP